MDNKSEGYEIVEYRPELRDQVLQLQTLMWSPDVRTNAAYLDWKYTHNPYLEKPIICLAMRNGQVVGMRCMFGMRWEGGQAGQTFRCLQDADAVVHPEHRRRGLLDRMNTMVLAEGKRNHLDYVFTLSGNQFSIASILKQGWHSVGEVQALQRPARREEDSRMRKLVRRLPLLPSVYRRLRTAASDLAASSPGSYAPYEAFDRRCASRRAGEFSRVQVEKAPRPQAMAALVARVGHDGRLRHVRDQEFFAWRFQNPLSEYRFLFWADVGLEGYLVLHMAAQPGEAPWCTIVDWEATSTLARAELLEAAIWWGDFENLVVWSATLSDQIKSLLNECSFNLFPAAETNAENAFCPRLLMRCIREEADEVTSPLAGRQLLDMSNWDLRAIYSDNF